MKTNEKANVVNEKANVVNEKANVVETTEKYWDCECENNFIHPKTQTECSVCGATAEEQPDSRVNEVLMYGFPL